VVAVDIGVDVHDEDGAGFARENVQVINEKLAALASQRGVEVV
jgi:hypothetical protein